MEGKEKSLSIVEDSYYEHPEHGTVKLVSAKDDEVLLEKQTEEVFTEVGNIPAGASEPLEDFKTDAEPANISTTVDAVELDLESMTTGVGGGGGD